MKNFVLDSSFALAWVLQDEATEGTDAVLDWFGRGAKAFVPPLWHWEISNALLGIERQKRATPAEINQHLLRFRAFPIEVDDISQDQVWSSTHLLARKHKLTSYDAAYLESSIRRGLPIASLDSALLAAAKAENVMSVLDV